jgi:hypothetical protein
MHTLPRYHLSASHMFGLLFLPRPSLRVTSLALVGPVSIRLRFLFFCTNEIATRDITRACLLLVITTERVRVSNTWATCYSHPRAPRAALYHEHTLRPSQQPRAYLLRRPRAVHTLPSLALPSTLTASSLPTERPLSNSCPTAATPPTVAIGFPLTLSATALKRSPTCRTSSCKR